MEIDSTCKLHSIHTISLAVVWYMRMWLPSYTRTRQSSGTVVWLPSYIHTQDTTWTNYSHAMFCQTPTVVGLVRLQTRVS